jgi:hypothetical protein
MKKIALVLFLVLLAGTAFATPSTTYWTPDVMDIQPYKVVHLGIDNYSITTRPSSHNPQDGPTPGINLGIFNVGTKTGTVANGATDQDIVDFIVGKTLPGNLGRVHLAVYEGNSKVLKSSDGSTHNKGYMVAYDYGFHSVKDKAGNEYNQFVLAADYASGKNAIGGGGGGLYYYFTKDISLLTGPVWFNDKGINGPMKWTSQLDINF